MARFPKKVQEELDHYVYRLVDPRDGSTFYVGMGKGNRIFDQHAERKIEPSAKGGRMPARRILREIAQAGLEPLRIVHRGGMTRDQARHVEAALISAYPRVTNRKPKDGPMNACQLTKRSAVDGDD